MSPRSPQMTSLPVPCPACFSGGGGGAPRPPPPRPWPPGAGGCPWPVSVDPVKTMRPTTTIAKRDLSSVVTMGEILTGKWGRGSFLEDTPGAMRRVFSKNDPRPHFSAVQPVGDLGHQDVLRGGAECIAEVAPRVEEAGAACIFLREVPHEEQRAAAHVLPSEDDVAAHRLAVEVRI